MKATDIVQPMPMATAIAANGSKDNIPQEQSSATDTWYCSVEKGFPDITMKPMDEGGYPPRGQGANGLFYIASDQKVYLQNGGSITFDQDVSDEIGGYPQGAVLDYIENGNFNKVISLIDDNTYNFVNDPTYINGTYWQKLSFSGDDFLNYHQITNCLLDVPQRIKYSLNNGAFTLLKNSIVVVPYGTTDLSETYPIGSSFVNENLKVVDREYYNGNFIVWLETQIDVALASDAGNATITPKLLALAFDSGAIAISLNENSGVVSVASDASAPSPSLFYNTNTNLVLLKSSGGVISAATRSFPFCSVANNATYSVAEVRQIFNGLGHIGSIVWANKGIKGLIPDGFNEDGTLKNEEFTTEHLLIHSISSLSSGGYRFVGIGAQTIIANAPYYTIYNSQKNINEQAGTQIKIAKAGYIWSDINANNRIQSISNDCALNFNSFVDGQWQMYSLTLANSYTAPTSDTDFDLSTFLPNDGHIYEILVTVAGHTGTSSGNRLRCTIETDMNIDASMIDTITRTASSANGASTAILPVSTERKLTLIGYSGNSGVVTVVIRGYRRVGKNM